MPSDVGYRWSTSFQEYVGAVLPRSQCDYVKFTVVVHILYSYMVDAADHEKLEASRNELHGLLDKPQLLGIPVLVLGNKKDLPNAFAEHELITALNLGAITDREICCYSISCKEQENIGEINLIINS
ncbi:unnamed protein product [Schistosoma margrebowiei]|uniref:Uncharacterized protein n=1 Tax=Schistosoma margrebowiei TaxID=48269 RepID=A0AA84ZX35_9TREM|nr:unnamed protein product [Schistosoma margrebowiei]